MRKLGQLVCMLGPVAKLTLFVHTLWLSYWTLLCFS